MDEALGFQAMVHLPSSPIIVSHFLLKYPIIINITEFLISPFFKGLFFHTGSHLTSPEMLNPHRCWRVGIVKSGIQRIGRECIGIFFIELDQCADQLV